MSFVVVSATERRTTDGDWVALAVAWCVDAADGSPTALNLT
jgi:hypothetical protein